MAKRTPASRSRNTRKGQARKSPPPPVASPGLGIPSTAEIMRDKARGRTEADMIASALQDAPPLDREGMGAERYPFNDIASSEAVQAVVEKLVRRRIPDNPWNEVHKPLCKTDQSGNGYWSWLDAFRDVAFLVGVDYALQSRPDWQITLDQLPEAHRPAVERVIRLVVEASAAGDVRKLSRGAMVALADLVALVDSSLEGGAR